MNWFGTTRLRVGHVVGSSLAYLTAGIAYAHFTQNLAFSGFIGGLDGNYSRSLARAGWVVGAGVELPLRNSWSAKMEYLYSEYVRQSEQYRYFSFDTVTLNFPTQHVLRIGLNYKVTALSVATVATAARN